MGILAQGKVDCWMRGKVGVMPVVTEIAVEVKVAVAAPAKAGARAGAEVEAKVIEDGPSVDLFLLLVPVMCLGQGQGLAHGPLGLPLSVPEVAVFLLIGWK